MMFSHSNKLAVIGNCSNFSHTQQLLIPYYPLNLRQDVHTYVVAQYGCTNHNVWKTIGFKEYPCSQI